MQIDQRFTVNVSALRSATDHKRVGMIYAADSTASGPNLRIVRMNKGTSAQIRAEGLNVVPVLDRIAAGSIGAVHALIRNMIQNLSGLAVA